MTATRLLPTAIALVSLGAAGGGCDGGTKPPEIGPTADSLVTAAFNAYWSGETDSAAVWYRAALERARNRGDPSNEAKALTGLARVAWRRGDYQDARRLGQESLDLKRQRGLHDQLFDSHNLLGLTALYEGRYSEAIGQHRTALELAEAAADTTNLAKVWTNLALSHIEIGEFGEARRLLTRALPAARVSRDGVIEGRVLTNLGMLAVRTGSPDSAVPLLNDGLAILRSAGDGDGEQNNLGQLGTAYAALGDLARAIGYLDSAVNHAKKNESPREEASNLEQLAALHREAGEFPRALDLLGRARAINVELGLSEETGLNLRTAAEIHLELDNLAAAAAFADSALETHRRGGARLALLGDHLVSAQVAAARGDRSRSRSELSAAAALANEMGSPPLKARVALAAAKVADGEGDSKAVLTSLERARPDLSFAGLDRDWEMPWLASRAWARSGRLDSAVALGRQAVDAVERVRIELGSAWRQTSYLAERTAVYSDLVEVLLRQGRAAEALEFADGARGRVLLDRLAAERAGSTSSAWELAAGERQLQTQLEQLLGRIDQLEGESDRDLASRYRRELDQLYGGLEQIRAEFTAALIRSESREPSRRSLLGGRPDAAKLRAALRPDEVLLEYFIGAARSHLFVVTRDRIVPLAIEVGRVELEARIRVVREIVARRADPDAVDPALEALHEILLAPARTTPSLAAARRLVVVPHGVLAHLPFAALRDPRTHRYLVEDYTLLSLPSAGVLPALRGRVAAPSANGSIGFAPFGGDLPESVTEIKALQTALASSQVVVGRAASEFRVRQALQANQIVHLATHGVLNARNPLFSRLELSPGGGAQAGSGDDGRLEVFEVDRTPISASLVFLSGCETGLAGGAMAGDARGEDYTTLARAFLHAGATNVVATLWRIEDAGAATFAAAFYRELARIKWAGSAEVTDGLAFAQREMLRQQRYRSPFYWAGYLLSGSGDLGAKPVPGVRS